MLNRAVGKARIFGKQRDCEALEEVIGEAKERLPMRVLAWCVGNRGQLLTRDTSVKSQELTPFPRKEVLETVQGQSKMYRVVRCIQESTERGQRLARRDGSAHTCYDVRGN